MNYLIFLFVCLFISFLVVKFAKYVGAICLILLSLLGIGLIIIPFDLQVGIKLITWAFCILVMTGILFAISGIVSALVVSPIILLWGAIKMLFSK